MATLGDIMTTDVLTVTPDSTLSHVARELRHRNVGSAIVVEEERPIGIISERELVDSVAGSRNPDQGTVQLWMRNDVLSVDPDTSLHDAAEVMRAHDVRHLTVTRDGRLVGVVSIRDLLVGKTAA